MAGFVEDISKGIEATNELCANSDLDEDGVHGGRMKPLSSLGIPAKKGPNLSAKFPPSQVLTAARVGTRARHRTRSYGNGKRNAMIRIQRMHVRAKKCKRINRNCSRHGGSEGKLTALPAWTVKTSNSKNRAEHLQSTRDKDLDSASNLTSEGLEASTRVLDNINSSSRETALSCFQEQKCVDFAEKETNPPEESLVHSVTGLAPEVHVNLAKSREGKSLRASTELLKERMFDELTLTQGDDDVNSLHTKTCIDPMLKNMLTSIVKAEDEDESVAEGKDTCGVIVNTTTCKSIHVAKGYCDLSKTTPSSFQFSDMLYDEFKGEKCVESFTAESGVPFQVASGRKLSHATCLGPHSANSSGFPKGIKVDKLSLERFLATNSKIIKRGVSPQKSGDSDILKQMAALNPGIINKLRDKKQVHAALEAIIGASAVNAISSEKKDPSLTVENQQKTSDEDHGIDCDYEGRPTKRRKSIGFGLRFAQMNLSVTGGCAATIPLMDMETQATDMDTKTKATHMMGEVVMEAYSTENFIRDSCKHVDTDTRVYKSHSLQASDNILKTLSMHKLEKKPDISGAKQQNDSGANSVRDQAIPYQQRSHALLQVANKTTANVASCWLELLRLDIKGRLSALKRSRRRIHSVIVSGQLEDKMCCADDAFRKTSRWDTDGGGKRDSQTMEMDKWRSFFLHMDGVLHSEGARLENWLNQIDEMQSHCQKSIPTL